MGLLSSVLHRGWPWFAAAALGTIPANGGPVEMRLARSGDAFPQVLRLTPGSNGVHTFAIAERLSEFKLTFPDLPAGVEIRAANCAPVVRMIPRRPYHLREGCEIRVTAQKGFRGGIAAEVEWSRGEEPLRAGTLTLSLEPGESFAAMLRRAGIPAVGTAAGLLLLLACARMWLRRRRGGRETKGGPDEGASIATLERACARLRDENRALRRENAALKARKEAAALSSRPAPATALRIGYETVSPGGARVFQPLVEAGTPIPEGGLVCQWRAKVSGRTVVRVLTNAGQENALWLLGEPNPGIAEVAAYILQNPPASLATHVTANLTIAISQSMECELTARVEGSDERLRFVPRLAAQAATSRHSGGS